MRIWGIAIVLLAAACQQQAKQPAEPAEVAFDGAHAANAAARRAHGERLTRVLGCRGCHGKELQGERFYELYAANLTRGMQELSDDDFRRVLCEGVHEPGEDVWGMPSEIFQHLGGPDTDALIAYLRTLNPAGPPNQPRLPWEPETAKLIAAGELKPAAEFVRESKSLAPVDVGPKHALGRYITRVTCAECHGPKLEGRPKDTPDLIVTGAYSREEFERLITQGTAKGDRKLKPLMIDVAKNRFAHLTPQERDALYAYLKTRADRPQ